MCSVNITKKSKASANIGKKELHQQRKHKVQLRYAIENDEQQQAILEFKKNANNKYE